MKSPRYFKSFIKGRRGERGVTAVEFALVAPVFLMFVLGVIDIGRLFWAKNLLQYGVGEAARYVMVNPTTTKAILETYAGDKVSDLLSGITFTADVADTDVVNDVTYRTVSGSYTFTYLMPFMTISDTILTATIRTPVNE